MVISGVLSLIAFIIFQLVMVLGNIEAFQRVILTTFSFLSALFVMMWLIRFLARAYKTHKNTKAIVAFVLLMIFSILIMLVVVAVKTGLSLSSIDTFTVESVLFSLEVGYTILFIIFPLLMFCFFGFLSALGGTEKRRTAIGVWSFLLPFLSTWDHRRRLRTNNRGRIESCAQDLLKIPHDHIKDQNLCLETLYKLLKKRPLRKRNRREEKVLGELIVMLLLSEERVLTKNQKNYLEDIFETSFVDFRDDEKYLQSHISRTFFKSDQIHFALFCYLKPFFKKDEIKMSYKLEREQHPLERITKNRVSYSIKDRVTTTINGKGIKYLVIFSLYCLFLICMLGVFVGLLSWIVFFLDFVIFVVFSHNFHLSLLNHFLSKDQAVIFLGHLDEVSLEAKVGLAITVFFLTSVGGFFMVLGLIGFYKGVKAFRKRLFENSYHRDRRRKAQDRIQRLKVYDFFRQMKEKSQTEGTEWDYEAFLSQKNIYLKVSLEEIQRALLRDLYLFVLSLAPYQGGAEELLLFLEDCDHLNVDNTNQLLLYLVDWVPHINERVVSAYGAKLNDIYAHLLIWIKYMDVDDDMKRTWCKNLDCALSDKINDGGKDVRQERDECQLRDYRSVPKDVWGLLKQYNQTVATRRIEKRYGRTLEDVLNGYQRLSSFERRHLLTMESYFFYNIILENTFHNRKLIRASSRKEAEVLRALELYQLMPFSCDFKSQKECQYNQMVYDVNVKSGRGHHLLYQSRILLHRRCVFFQKSDHETEDKIKKFHMNALKSTFLRWVHYHKKVSFLLSYLSTFFDQLEDVDFSEMEDILKEIGENEQFSASDKEVIQKAVFYLWQAKRVEKDPSLPQFLNEANLTKDMKRHFSLWRNYQDEVVPFIEKLNQSIHVPHNVYISPCVTEQGYKIQWDNVVDFQFHALESLSDEMVMDLRDLLIFRRGAKEEKEGELDWSSSHLRKKLDTCFAKVSQNQNSFLPLNAAFFIFNQERKRLAQSHLWRTVYGVPIHLLQECESLINEPYVYSKNYLLILEDLMGHLGTHLQKLYPESVEWHEKISDFIFTIRLCYVTLQCYYRSSEWKGELDYVLDYPYFKSRGNRENLRGFVCRNQKMNFVIRGIAMPSGSVLLSA